MAIKEWKRKNSYTWQKKNSTVKIIQDVSGNGLHANAYIIDVFEFETKNRNSRGFEKQFKTKSAALKFARAYMKKN